MKMYKLRFYFVCGRSVGAFSHEEFFSSLELMNFRYREVFKYELFSLNPTRWFFDESINCWCLLRDI